MKRKAIFIIIVLTTILAIVFINHQLMGYISDKTDDYCNIKNDNPCKYYYLYDFDSTAREALVIEDLDFKDSLGCAAFSQDGAKKKEIEIFQFLTDDSIKYWDSHIQMDQNLNNTPSQ